jgi:endonuclease-3
MNQTQRQQFFSRLRDHNPSPTTELNYKTPFELLIAVILSAQATDVGVNKATDKLYPVANTPQAILDLGLEALPGVGRKTANVILNTVFKHPVMAVDTHIFRLSNRTGLAKGKNVREVEDRLMKVIPDEFKLDAHHWLILHGRYVCTARKPHCDQCIVTDLCDEYRRTQRQRKTA